jgi:endonuclease YncB( thermonuclease family)
MENSDSVDIRRTTLLTERKDLLFKQPSRIAIALFLSWLSIAQAAAFTGPVVSVLASGIIEVLHNTHPERVRLSGIDCPEKSRAFGNRAK